MRAASLLAAIALVASATTAAQAQAQAPVDEPGEPLGAIEDCAIVPEGGTGGGTGATPGGESLSDALAPCDGVIAPPEDGATGLVIPPPPVGETPVIPPEQVPEQPAGE